MKLKKIFFLLSLAMLLAGQSLYATEDTDLADQKRALVQQVKGFLNRSARAIALGDETPNNERKDQYLQLALNELGDAIRLLHPNLDLADSNQPLIVRAYFELGSLLVSISALPCDRAGCNCREQ